MLTGFCKEAGRRTTAFIASRKVLESGLDNHFNAFKRIFAF